MENTKNILREFIMNKSQFLDLPDGETVEVTFLSAQKITTNFKGKELEAIRYEFELNGKKVNWDRTSRELAKQMSNFISGDVLVIKRTGQKNQTKYEIKKV